MTPLLIFLMGPTASGKTELAVQLVQHFPCEIISVDSAMVYRGMDIGTAKPGAEILQIAPHRLIDIREPNEPYSAAQFREDALREIAEVTAKNKIPLLVGGTMLYFRALQMGLADMPAADPGLRAALLQEGMQHGWPLLHERLATIDPVAAARIHPHDSQRIQRALEVFALTGKNLTTWQQSDPNPLAGFTIRSIALAPTDRQVLHDRIAQRFVNMLQAGFVAEVEKLCARGDLNLHTPAIRSVGYRQVWEYLQGDLTFEQMQAQGIIATRQLAKRQLTWLRSWPEIAWFKSESQHLLEEVSQYCGLK